VTDRRQFIQSVGALAALASWPSFGLATEAPRLPSRLIPGTDERLPIIGMGNSYAFREGDRETSWKLIRIFQEHGSRYIDVGGPSRYTVGRIVGDHGLLDSVFLGSYFSGENDLASRAEASRLLEMTGKPALDLMHNYPEDAVPYWDSFRRWKDEGVTRYIGVARHRSEYYDMMMGLMQTGTVDFLQVNYSLLETEAEERILPLAIDMGVAVTINRPFLNGRYFDVVRGHELPAWAAEFDCHSWAQFSLKFILSHPAVHCVLTETANPRHALDNLGAGYGRLPDKAERVRMLEHLRSIA
jgi:diketogulonate reductase-like aldo/keto reductase